MQNDSKKLSRRAFLAATGAVAALSPWLLSACARMTPGEMETPVRKVGRRYFSGGVLNVVMWSDYLPPSFLRAFREYSGIQVNHMPVNSNEELLGIMKSSGGEGVDICCPTSMRAPQWETLGLLQPIDLDRIRNLDGVMPGMVELGAQWDFDGFGWHWIPHVWGTEGIAWRVDRWQPSAPPSYGNIWQKGSWDAAMCRPHSGMMGAGLYMETVGALEPGSMWRAYEGEDMMRPVWEAVTEWCINRSRRIKLFWNSAQDQKDGFVKSGIAVAQTWDGPILSLKRQGVPVEYRAPSEGALTWVDGMAISARAQNIDEAYAFIDFCYEARAAAMAVEKHGYNSVVTDARQFTSEVYKQNFAAAYPRDALAKLRPWPSEPQWYADMRDGYREQFIKAYITAG